MIGARDQHNDRTSEGAIPLWLKGVYTAFVCVLVPVYWRTYGPANFLWFCDAALLITAIALWLESPLLAGMQALAMTVPQAVWIGDFLTGGRLMGISGYMFERAIPLHVRLLSTFHIWLPLLLVWMVWRLGYDRRALACQTALAVALLLASYAFTDPARPPKGYPAAAVNVNRVFGPAPTTRQLRMPAWLYLSLEAAFWIACFYVPSHCVFLRVFPRPPAGRRRTGHGAGRWHLARQG